MERSAAQYRDNSSGESFESAGACFSAARLFCTRGCALLLLPAPGPLARCYWHGSWCVVCLTGVIPSRRLEAHRGGGESARQTEKERGEAGRRGESARTVEGESEGEARGGVDASERGGKAPSLFVGFFF